MRTAAVCASLRLLTACSRAIKAGAVFRVTSLPRFPLSWLMLRHLVQWGRLSRLTLPALPAVSSHHAALINEAEGRLCRAQVSFPFHDADHDVVQVYRHLLL